MKDIVVLYHANCPDGFGGAWVAKKKLGDQADYIPVLHADPPPDGLQGKDVYMIDFCYPSPETTARVLEQVKSLTIIDHHITAKDMIETAHHHLFDIERSGATLAWQYFFPNEPVPLLLQYIEGSDLWKFDLPRAEEFYALSSTLTLDFDVWDKLVADFEDEARRKTHLDRGGELLQYQQKIIEDVLKDAEEVVFEGRSALAANSPVLDSQIGNAIVKRGYDIGIIWSHASNGKIKVGLRSKKDGDVDVGTIAKKYRGGGHKSASGFSLDENDEFPWQKKS